MFFNGGDYCGHKLDNMFEIEMDLLLNMIV